MGVASTLDLIVYETKMPRAEAFQIEPSMSSSTGEVLPFKRPEQIDGRFQLLKDFTGTDKFTNETHTIPKGEIVEVVHLKQGGDTIVVIQLTGENASLTLQLAGRKLRMQKRKVPSIQRNPENYVDEVSEVLQLTREDAAFILETFAAVEVVPRKKRKKKTDEAAAAAVAVAIPEPVVEVKPKKFALTDNIELSTASVQSLLMLNRKDLLLVLASLEDPFAFPLRDSEGWADQYGSRIRKR